ncbi:MAG: CRISPR-associated endonuclease Cas1, partial [Culicoidibacterales bacterium]
MATHSCYLFQKGRLTAKDEAFFFESESLKRFIPPHSTEELHLFGAIEMNKRFFQLAKVNQIQVHMYDQYTHYIGSFIDYQNNTNGELLVKQVLRQADEQQRLMIAKAILFAGFKQILKNIKYYHNRRPTEQFGQAIHDITISLGRLEQVTTIQSAMLLEAHIRQVYYRCFDKILCNPDFVFERRSIRPPHNALNAMISFGNTVLYNIIMNEIMRTKLDIRIGFLHETQNRRTTTLNLDLAEIFKPLIVDRLIFRLINRQQIKSTHFKETSD